MADIKSFKIDVPDSKIQRLKQKLSMTDYPDEPDNYTPWQRGVPMTDIKRLAQYWEHGFDWRKAEARLNRLPQFLTPIDVDGYGTLDIHFVHQKSNVQNAIPLLFVHGWPGSFIEVSKILPILVKGGPDVPAFHVVAPSLVDYGFSAPAPKSGYNVDHHAEAFHKLMLKLGYDQYVTQGGDLGYFITRVMAKSYPEAVKAHHINMAIPAPPTLKDNPALFAKMQVTPLTAEEQAGMERTQWFKKEGSGYNNEHSTKPQTIGFSMTDSPVGLLAWIYEKLHDWTDGYPWTDDEVLTWISIYYFSRAGPAATQRIYYEFTHREPPTWSTCSSWIDVPLGISRHPKELYLHPKLWHETMGPVVLFNTYEKGGHFAAWEHPEDIVQDLRTMLQKGGPVFACVAGRNGYDEHRANSKL